MIGSNAHSKEPSDAKTARLLPRWWVANIDHKSCQHNAQYDL